MKNKKILYLLVPLVFIIWGIIIYKVIHQFKGEEITSSGNTLIKPTISDNNVEDTLTLMLDYRDPFLSGNIGLPKTIYTSDEIFERGEVMPREKTVINFPSITYSGVVINAKSKQKTGLLKVDKRDFLIKEGELISELKIVKLYQDSVLVVYKKTKKSFYKNNRYDRRKNAESN